MALFWEDTSRGPVPKNNLIEWILESKMSYKSMEQLLKEYTHNNNIGPILSLQFREHLKQI